MRIGLTAIGLTLTVALSMQAGAPDPKEFATPGAAYRPETWFHLIGGNIATNGLTADLEAVARAGFAGIQLFHGHFGGPWPGVEPQIRCLTPEWDRAIRHVADECQRLHLRFTMQNCPGWAMAGGPWIAPADAMRELVWSRLDVPGGSALTVTLPQPQPSSEDWRDYRDTFVLAFPTPAADTARPLAPVSVRSNRDSLPWTALFGLVFTNKVRLEPAAEPAWVEVTFAEPVTLRTLVLPSVRDATLVRYFDPGAALRVQAVTTTGLVDVARRELPRTTWQEDRSLTLALPETTATTFRLTFEQKTPLELAFLHLYSAARIDNWEGQAAYVLRSLDPHFVPAQDPLGFVPHEKVFDLTGQMDPTGKLSWHAPAGSWTVLRFGHVNTGAKNGPAPPEATGFECNKFSPAAAEKHFAGYIGRLTNPGGPGADGRLKGLLLDSWECRTQTWTPEMEREFKLRCGYDLRHWLPALAGYVVENHEASTRFLRDWRATVNSLYVDGFYGTMARLGHARGLQVAFETAMGDVAPGDIMEYFRYADVPMCEFWQPNDPDWGGVETKPVLPCISAAHLYGKPRVAAEAFTSMVLRWDEHPFSLKPFADRHLADGLNQLVFHTFTHNPRLEKLPGTSFGTSIGTPFIRGQTWWPHVRQFTDYLSRCHYLLQQGQPVSDVLWYLGDELDHKPRQDTPFPAGYRFDYCNTDVLLHRLAVRNGRLVTPEGLAYRALWLRDCPRLLPETVERLHSLVKAGALVIGDSPHGSATLAGGVPADRRFQEAVRSIWGEGPTGERKVGSGKVIWGTPLETALAREAILPDVLGEGVRWCHRRSSEMDWYFVAGPQGAPLRTAPGFLAEGQPELWDPVAGTVEPAPLVRREGPRTFVTLDLPPSGSRFVVFRRNTAKTAALARIARDGRPVWDTSPAASAEVVSATYGAPADASRQADVSALVRAALQSPMPVVTPNNAWAGGDPALGTVKRLRVVLRQAGREEVRVASENETLSLLLDPPPPSCRLLTAPLRLVAWEPGAYQLEIQGGVTLTKTVTAGARMIQPGPWTLAFPEGWEAPASVALDELKSWTELDSPAARAFSGSATYTCEFEVPQLSPDDFAELDLGRVAVIAVVTLNDQRLATLWAPPFRVDLSRALKSGRNRLKVEVTNTWRNRLAYDAGLPAAQRKTWTIAAPGKSEPLQPAGLLGPVQLRIARALNLN